MLGRPRFHSACGYGGRGQLLSRPIMTCRVADAPRNNAEGCEVRPQGPNLGRDGRLKVAVLHAASIGRVAPSGPRHWRMDWRVMRKVAGAGEGRKKPGSRSWQSEAISLAQWNTLMLRCFASAKPRSIGRSGTVHPSRLTCREHLRVRRWGVKLVNSSSWPCLTRPYSCRRPERRCPDQVRALGIKCAVLKYLEECLKSVRYNSIAFSLQVGLKRSLEIASSLDRQRGSYWTELVHVLRSCRNRVWT